MSCCVFYCLSAWTHFLSFATATASTTLLYGNSCAATFFCCYPAILVWQQLLLLWWVKWYEDISSLFSSPLLSSLVLSSLLFGSSCCSFAELNYMQTSLLSSTHLFSPLFYFLLSPLLFGSSSCSYSDLNNVQTSILSSLTSLLLSSIFFSLLSYLTVAAAPLLI